MHFIDWSIIGLYFIISAGVGVYFTKRAGQNIQEFFLTGRSLPWWLAGTSMVATTFAADTPLAVTELVRNNGIAGNWLWWNAMIGGMLTVFFFARLWRRAGIMTDVEFVELRYSGKPAAFLRGFRALYLGIFMNCVVMGWVNLAMASILEGMFGIPHNMVIFYVALAMIITAIYSAMSGLWGVAFTDAFQFILAMLGCIILAVVIVAQPQIGGMAGLVQKLQSTHPDALRFLPVIGGSSSSTAGTLIVTFSMFFAYIGLQWWASWYPGAEPGGGGYIAQRMMSAKDEKHSLFATLWFTIAHYCVRPWPWIIVGLSSLILYPELTDQRLGFVYAMRDFLPVGLKGLMVAAFFAAYMSTLSTQLNWGTSYIINDFYKRFIKPDAADRKVVLVSRIVTILMMVLSLSILPLMTSIKGAWEFILGASAGIGMVLILRWYWWRINAWSEIVAMVVPLAIYAYMKKYTQIKSPEDLYFIVPITTICWLLATFLTRPTDEKVLLRFYEKVHPFRKGWRPIAGKLPKIKPDEGFSGLVIDWLAGIVLVFCTLFGVGKFLLGETNQGIGFLIFAIGAALVIIIELSKRGFEKVVR